MGGRKKLPEQSPAVRRASWEQAARERKAGLLAALLRRQGVTAETAAAASPELWRQWADTAGVRAPSEQTVAMVVRSLARPRPADPFDRLPNRGHG